ncbi:hypothetical protein GCM10022236_01930 [Microlunatus ginsengisoli]|uniref:Uncharacterized protein n=1 Tax=Microlunatus ginsengisoli TaxID=363863 RepID=A0ABP6ZAL2_9ACTN
MGYIPCEDAKPMRTPGVGGQAWHNPSASVVSAAPGSVWTNERAAAAETASAAPNPRGRE